MPLKGLIGVWWDVPLSSNILTAKALKNWCLVKGLFSAALAINFQWVLNLWCFVVLAAVTPSEVFGPKKLDLSSFPVIDDRWWFETNSFYFHPENWGRCPFWLVSKGLKPPTRFMIHSHHLDFLHLVGFRDSYGPLFATITGKRADPIPLVTVSQY